MSDACPELCMDSWSSVSPPPHGGHAISIHWCGNWDRFQIIISLWVYVCGCKTFTASLLLGLLNKLSLVVPHYLVFLFPPMSV